LSEIGKSKTRYPVVRKRGTTRYGDKTSPHIIMQPNLYKVEHYVNYKIIISIRIIMFYTL